MKFLLIAPQNNSIISNFVRKKIRGRVLVYTIPDM